MNSSFKFRFEKRAWIYFFLLIITFSLFWPARNFEFLTHDDPFFVSQNPYVQAGLTKAGIEWAFTADLVTDSKFADYWRPITFISHMIDAQFFGMNPKGHHLMSVFLHFLNACLIYLILNKITGSTWKSAFAAALFAVHPLQVQAVSWISARKDLLSCFFSLLTIWTYLPSRSSGDGPKRDRPRPYKVAAVGRSVPFGTVPIITVCCFALGLMSKPSLVSLPFLLILMDYWPLGKMNGKFSAVKQSLTQKLPLLLLAQISILIVLFGHSESGTDASNNVAGFGIWSVLNIPCNYFYYFWKTVFPIRPSIYPMPFEEPLTFLKILSDAIILFGISGIIFQKRKQFPFLFTGWFWFVISLAPSAILLCADRHMYFPMVGLLIAFVWTISALVEKLQLKKSICSMAAAFIILGLMILSRAQLEYWKDSIRLFSHAVETTSHNSRAHYLLATALSEKNNRLDEAIFQFKAAIESKPADAGIYLGIGSALAKQGKFGEAIHYFQKAIKTLPSKEVRATSDNDIGYAFAQMGKLRKASYYYKKALAKKPDFPQPYFNLGNLMVQMKQFDKAVYFYSETLRMDPRYDQARNELGALLMRMGKKSEAMDQFEIILKNNPNFADAHNNLGVILYANGKKEEAVRHFRQALKIKPNYESARKNLEAAGRAS